MTRHIIDRPVAGKETGRMRNFLAVERQEKANPAEDALKKRSHEQNEVRRMREYLRIERGRTA